MPGLSESKASVKDIAACILFAAFFFSMYCLVYFVTAAFVATSSGLIKWGEGWQAPKDLFS